MQNADGSSCRSLPASLLGIFFSFCPSLSHEAQSSRHLLYRQTYDSSANVGVFEKQNRAGTKHCLCCPKSVQTAAACLRPASRPQALPPPAPPSGVCTGLCICTVRIKGTAASTCWGRRQPAPKLKAAPRFWERWQSRRT